jgi:hypothetical protein
MLAALYSGMPWDIDVVLGHMYLDVVLGHMYLDVVLGHMYLDVVLGHMYYADVVLGAHVLGT